ncbi:MAG: hypothetical protein FJ260_08385 [Planctomycetes bacterium]|nr:hypothetical protein [Planctomycetota bacterium]
MSVADTGSPGMTASWTRAAVNTRSTSSSLAAGRAASCTAMCVHSAGTAASALRTVSQRSTVPPATTVAPWKPSCAP